MIYVDFAKRKGIPNMAQGTDKPSREVYMNYCKAFAIIAMVIGHTGSPLNSYIYQYHMALFIFIAGYFYKDYYSEHPTTLVIKRIKSLYLPFVYYNLLFVIICNIFTLFRLIDKSYNIFTLEGIKGFIKSILSFNAYVSFLGGFWFVKTLFLTTILFCVVSFALKRMHLEKEWTRALLIITIYIIEWVIMYKKIQVSKNLIQAPMALPIFYIGYLFHRYREHIKFNYLYPLISLAIICITKNWGFVDMDSLTYTGPLFYLIASIAGICLNISIADILFKHFGEIKYLNFIGGSTYTILAFHLLAKAIFYKFLNYLNVYEYSWLWILDVIIAVNVSLLLRWLWIKIKQCIFSIIKDSKSLRNEET